MDTKHSNIFLKGIVSKKSNQNLQYFFFNPIQILWETVEYKFPYVINDRETYQPEV